MCATAGGLGKRSVCARCEMDGVVDVLIDLWLGVGRRRAGPFFLALTCTYFLRKAERESGVYSVMEVETRDEEREWCVYACMCVQCG